MPASPADTVAIYRASIVGAVKRSSVLMSDLVRLVRAQWQQHETPGQASAQEAQALQHLVRVESRLVAQYPLAMLELFAQGVPAQTGSVSATSKLLEIGKDDARLRVEMVRARQRIAHEVAPALSELDTLIGAAQGFDRVQPERNPLRPGNYVRALFGVVYGAGAPPELARLWLTPMQSGLGTLLAREYRRVSEDLRARGVQPLHYVATGRSRFAGLVTDEPFAQSRTDAMESFLAPIGQEALPGIDASMWDSLRSPAPLTALGALEIVADDFAPTAHGLGHDGTASAQLPLEETHDLPVPQRREEQGAEETAAQPIREATEAPVAAASAPGPAAGGVSPDTSLSVGEWVDIEGTHGVVRTQLTWLSPRNTLFLFTQADGSTQSMTSRMVARLLQSGAMKRMAS